MEVILVCGSSEEQTFKTFPEGLLTVVLLEDNGNVMHSVTL